VYKRQAPNRRHVPGPLRIRAETDIWKYHAPREPGLFD